MTDNTSMNSILRNVLAIFSGLVLGSVANMALVMIGGYFKPLPEGLDLSSTESTASAIEGLGAEYFIWPLLAHALGTVVAAFVVSRVAATHHFALALGIGAFFLVMGAINIAYIPAPAWFNVTDLTLAYIPMAVLGHKLAGLVR